MAHRKPEGEGGYARALSKQELARSWMVMGNNSPVGVRVAPSFKHAPTRSPSRTNNQKKSMHMVRPPPAHKERTAAEVFSPKLPRAHWIIPLTSGCVLRGCVSEVVY